MQIICKISTLKNSATSELTIKSSPDDTNWVEIIDREGKKHIVNPEILIEAIKTCSKGIYFK